MRKGLLAQWRRGIVARGLAAAALLAVPVAVAATIGFGTSLSGLSEGLGTLASGPDQGQAEQAAERDPIDTAISAVATATTGGRGSAPSGAAPGLPGGGGGDAPTGGSSPDDAPTAPEASDGTAAGDDGIVTVPEVDTPNSGPGTGPVGDLLERLGGAIDGIVGRQP